MLVKKLWLLLIVSLLVLVYLLRVDIISSVIINTTALGSLKCIILKIICTIDEKEQNNPIDIVPGNDRLLRILGQINWYQKEYSRSIDYLRAIESPDKISRFFLASALYETGEEKDAIDIWRSMDIVEYFIIQEPKIAIQLASLDGDQLYRIGETLWFRGEVAESVVYYRQFVSQEPPESPRSLVAQARIYQAAEEWEEAVKIYTRLLELYPDAFWEYVSLGRILQLHLGRPEEALQWYQRCIDTSRCAYHAYIFAGNIIESLYQDPERAIRYYLTSDRLSPQQPWGLLSAANTYQAIGDWNAAIAVYEQVGDRFGRSVAYELGMVNLGAGDWSRAVVYLNQALQDKTVSDTQVYLLLAKAYCIGGKLSESVHAYQKILAEEPENSAAQTGLKAVEEESSCGQ